MIAAARQAEAFDVAVVLLIVALAVLGCAALVVAVLGTPPPEQDEFDDIAQLNRQTEARAAMGRASNRTPRSPR